MIDDTVYFAYDKNEECEACMFGKQVIAEDYAVYIICFTSYIKKEDPCAGFTKRLSKEMTKNGNG